MSALLLDTHVVHRRSAELSRLSARAAAAVEAADELAVAAISRLELAWLARHERIVPTVPVRSWLATLAAHVRTIAITPAIADTAVALPSSFPGDPANRLLVASAIEHGMKLVTKDRRIRAHVSGRSLAVW